MVRRACGSLGRDFSRHRILRPHLHGTGSGGGATTTIDLVERLWRVGRFGGV